MGDFAATMLFLPPLPPLQLPASGSVVLGRSRSCEFTLKSADASRRHAEIVAVTGGYLLRDLGSTNGTFVNGERIQERSLRPGDRIEIGGDIIAFCQVEPRGERGGSGEAKTMMLERPALGESFEGNLSDIPAFAVLQMLEMGRNTGVLDVDCDSGTARLWLSDGAPIHAETKQQRGFDAAMAVATAQSGHFSFEPFGTPPERTIEATVTQLLLEATRLLDESA